MLAGNDDSTGGITIPRPGGYRFHEFEPASLGGMTGPAAWGADRERQLFGRTAVKAFGEFTFDTRPADPTVTFRLVEQTGAVLEEIVLRQSELTPGEPIVDRSH